MKKIGLIFILFFCLIINVNAETTLVPVIFNRCVDGDTAVFNVDGEEVKYRFIAIDTPETVKPNTEVQEFGKDASEYTCNKLTNAKVIVVEVEKSNKADKYGRSLGWIWVDGSLLQKELVEVGYAKVAYIYGKYRYTESLCLVQSHAKEKESGLWANQTEDGYCSTVDLSNVEDIISYDNISQNIPEKKDEEESEPKLTGTLAQLNEIQNKVSDYIENNDEKLTNMLYYAIVIAAILCVIIKEIKK